MVAGCNSDDPVAPEPAGTIVVNPSPDVLAAPWSLVGPEAFATTGNGDQTLADLVPGEYSITWEEVADWTAPASETATLADGAVVTFTGVYAVSGGTLILDCTPDEIDAPWTLAGPGGYYHPGHGDETLTNLADGDYEVQWGAVTDWVRPAAASLTLSPAEIDTVAGVYQAASPYPFPGSEDQAMANLVAIQQAMDFDSYRELIHPNYMMILQPETQQEFPDLGPTLDRTEELRIAERMFAGEPVTDPDNVLVPGIGGITFQFFEQQGAWAVSAPTDVIPNTRNALFDVSLLFDRPGYTTLRVDGQAKFYVAGRDTVYDGENRILWQIVGVWDLTGSVKSTEVVSWGSVKALFR